MRHTLSNFYQSKEWVNLVTAIRLERVNSCGDVICDYCHEPIIRAYDCIGHHTVELTEDNVNDAMVSLNPELIQLVHHKCHNRIHNKFRYDEDMRQVFLVYGAPLSGKTTWVNDVKNKGDFIIDMDNIWQCVSGCERYDKPAVLKSIAFGVRDYLIECVKYRRGKWLNAYVIGGYPLISERERLCKELRAREIFIDTSKEECLRRLVNCDDGRDIGEWTKYILDWYKRYSPPYFT